MWIISGGNFFFLSHMIDDRIRRNFSRKIFNLIGLTVGAYNPPLFHPLPLHHRSLFPSLGQSSPIRINLIVAALRPNNVSKLFKNLLYRHIYYQQTIQKKY